MLLAIISLIDIIAGILLMFPDIFPPIVFYIAVLMIVKSISSLISGLLGRSFIVILGLIDLFAGLMLLFNFNMPWFWLLLMIKGSYSLIVGVLAR
jgi:uncharacterized membrane protein HdeD (DUF308 family)